MIIMTIINFIIIIYNYIIIITDLFIILLLSFIFDPVSFNIKYMKNINLTSNKIKIKFKKILFIICNFI